MKLYLAGPMSGIPQFNFPVFRAYAEQLRTLGHDVVNPAELDCPEHAAQAEESLKGDLGDVDNTWGECLGRDVRIVADEVEAVAMLPGWSKSRGALLEMFTAIACDKPVYTVEADYELRPVNRDVAARTVMAYIDPDWGDMYYGRA